MEDFPYEVIDDIDVEAGNELVIDPGEMGL